MSVHDAQRIAESLRLAGYGEARRPADADVLVLTTCSVREKARQKVRSAIGRMRSLKRRGEGPIVVVAGCVAQQDGQLILDESPHVDVVVSSDHLDHVPVLVARARDLGERSCLVGFDEEAPFLALGAVGERQVSAYVTIQKGCDEGCAYCIVPSVRGPGRCRDAGEVVREVEVLVERGAREIVLLGQTVNSYRKDGVPFGELLGRVTSVAGVWRVRYESAHPRFLDRSLVEAHLRHAAVCEHLHLPVQSGSDGVLHRMGRGHGRGEFLEWLVMLRAAIPGVGVSTDLFVGFPGETEQDFEETLTLLRSARFDGAFSFKYSPRPGTPASGLTDDVPPEVKADRLQRLQALQQEITSAYLASLTGRTVEVLVEGVSKIGGQLRGRSRRNTIVNIDGVLPTARAADGPSTTAGAFIGRLVDVEVTEAGAHSVRGRLAQPGARVGSSELTA